MGQPSSAARTALINSLTVTTPSPFRSKTRQSDYGRDPSAIRTPRTSSSMMTRRSPVQSPIHGTALVVGVGSAVSVAVAVGGGVEVGDTVGVDWTVTVDGAVD